MTFKEEVITIAAVAAATMLTRFLPFLLFPADKKTPAFVRYLGKVLPPAVFGLLVVYSIKDIGGGSPGQGFLQLIGIAVTVGLHLWKRQMLLSIAGGTVFYMFFLQTFFS